MNVILDTYKEKPRHFTQILKKNKDVIDYIKNNVPAHIKLFMEQLHYAVYRDSGICQFGNQKKLKSFDSYSFCGKAGVCECAKISVSKNVSITKQSYTEERQ